MKGNDNLGETWNQNVREQEQILQGLRNFVYIEQLLSHLREVQLSTESIIKIDPPPSLDIEELACFLSAVATARG